MVVDLVVERIIASQAWYLHLDVLAMVLASTDDIDVGVNCAGPITV